MGPRRVLCMLALLTLAACGPSEELKLHFLKGFVPGTRAIFLPTAVAVAPIRGELATGSHFAGNIYDPSGKVEQRLQVSEVGMLALQALIASLADAGLKPVALRAGVEPKDLPPRVEFMLICELEKVAVEKRFRAQQTIHGQYFTMTSRVKLKYRLLRRDGAVISENEILGTEDEPPEPVGHEVFLPMETDPAESLSVALSRAVGLLVIDPKFRAVFPARIVP